jgi:GDP-D-mannose 3',5'-epimerase
MYVTAKMEKFMKTALVLGGGGFIGNHMVNRLHNEGFWVKAVDLKRPEFSESAADEFIVGDLKDPSLCNDVFDKKYDEVYQFAADMGGAGYIFTKENDADIMHNSAQINLNVLDACVRANVGRVFYSSSACVYPQENQLDPDNPNCRESSAYPANPDSDYGWEKLFSERLYLAFSRNHGLTVRIARYHNVFGPLGTWEGGREKAPAAICRKIARAIDHDEIEIWGDGKQTRSFLFIDECLEGSLRLMRSAHTGPVNIGSDEMISIDGLVDLVTEISGKTIQKKHIPGPQGVRGRNSDNTLIQEILGWSPSEPLRNGIEVTYNWIKSQSQR